MKINSIKGKSSCRVICGGSWGNSASLLRCAYRIFYMPDVANNIQDNNLGIRLVRVKRINNED